jgi:hypothetical protein
LRVKRGKEKKRQSYLVVQGIWATTNVAIQTDGRHGRGFEVNPTILMETKLRSKREDTPRNAQNGNTERRGRSSERVKGKRCVTEFRDDNKDGHQGGESAVFLGRLTLHGACTTCNYQVSHYIPF